MIERPSIKFPTAIKIPTKLVTPSTPRDSGLNEMKKGVGSRQLPIIEFPLKFLLCLIELYYIQKKIYGKWTT